MKFASPFGSMGAGSLVGGNPGGGGFASLAMKHVQDNPMAMGRVEGNPDWQQAFQAQNAPLVPKDAIAPTSLEEQLMQRMAQKGGDLPAMGYMGPHGAVINWLQQQQLQQQLPQQTRGGWMRFWG